jgi:enamine deaminase RidA (YjgF/YER057c/UK114 family)
MEPSKARQVARKSYSGANSASQTIASARTLRQSGATFQENTMALKRIEPGKRMSAAVIHNGMAYLAGFVSENAKGKSVLEQTKDILNDIDATLKKAGTSKANIVKANIWLTDIATFAQMNEAWDGWVVPGQTPARATVESKLAAPGYDVEIMVEAAILKKAAKSAAARRPAKKSAKKAKKRK